MKSLSALVLREWLEWRRVILGTIIIFTFINLLGLFTVNRGGLFLDRKIQEEGHVLLDDIVINNEDTGENRISVDIRVTGDDVALDIEHLEGEGFDDDDWADIENKPAIPFAFYLRFTLQFIFGMVLFLALFYFTDAIYKERSDNTTLFYRSLPVSDHQIIASKLLAGLLGVIGLTFFLSLEQLAITRVAIWLLREPVSTFAEMFWDRIQLVSFMGDWFVYLLASAIRLLPLVLFLLIVSAWVKARPLIIGVGGPLLAGIAYAILFQSAQLLRWIFELFINLNHMLSEQWLIGEDYAGGDLELYGHFWGYIFSVETLFLLMASGGMYAFLIWLYRRNLPVN